MGAIRTLVSCGIVAGILTTAGGAAPLQSPPGPLEKQAKPVTPENPIPRRVGYEPTQYPADAAAAGARGSATLMITVDSSGRVVEARRTRVQVIANDPPVSVTLSGASPEDEARFLINQSVQQSDLVRSIAKAFTEEAIRSVLLWRYDPPASAPISFPVTVTIGPSDNAANLDTPPVITAATMGADDAPVRVGSRIHTPTKIRHVNPEYPLEAQARRVVGMVVVEAKIGRDGRVTDAKVLRSIPLLDQAAIDAVMQWEFTPTLLDGVPVPVIMTVTVNFAVK